MSNVQTLRDAYAAHRAGDLAGVLAALDERVEWHAPAVLPQGGDYQGHAGVAAFLQAIAANWTEPVVEVDAVVESGDRVMVTGSTTGRLHGEERITYGFAHSWLFHEGRVIRFTEYVDRQIG